MFQDLKAYFTVNSSLSVVTQVLIKHRMSTAVDISALRVNSLVKLVALRSQDVRVSGLIPGQFLHHYMYRPVTGGS